jgi:hypothetical protein
MVVQENKKRRRHRIYHLFLGMIIGAILVFVYEQIGYQGTDTYSLQLPWELEFQLRHRLGQRRVQESQDRDDESDSSQDLNVHKSLRFKPQVDSGIISSINGETERISAVISETGDTSQKKQTSGTHISKLHNHMKFLKLKAQKLVPMYGAKLSKNLNKLQGLQHEAKHSVKKNVNDRETSFKKSIFKEISSIVSHHRPSSSAKLKTHNDTLVRVPKLSESQLDHAIRSQIKPRRPSLPPIFIKLCLACEEAFLSDRFSCKRRIFPWVEKNPPIDALKEGQTFVANENEKCAACHPDNCEGTIHYPFRFDEGQPLVLQSKTHDLSSIPMQSRIPSEFIFMTDTYFKFWTRDRPPVLFTYNPSIIAIPSKTPHIDIHGASYIASYRVSPWHNCGFRTYNFHSKLWNLMGLAILDKNLDIIPGYDVIININELTQMKQSAQKFEDFRLFNFHDKIWLLDGSLIVPLEIGSNQKGKLNTMKDRLPILFGTGLSIRFSEPVKHLLKIPPGRNYNIFTASNGAVILETKPRHPRVTYELDFDGIYGAKEEGEYSSHMEPEDSFITDETFLRRPYLFGRDKGSACCVKLERRYFGELTSDPEILKFDYLLLGISNRRTFRKIKHPNDGEGTERFDYVSRLYAFVPEAPFTIVANSGIFCFGFPEDDEIEKNTYANATRILNRMEVNHKSYPCPTIQIATGMTEKIGDNDRIIVTYGVNDCIPRIVELHKLDLAHRLFLPLTEKSFVVTP